MVIRTDLREKRDKSHVTLRTLSERTGIHHNYINEIERGWRLASDKEKKALARALGVPLKWSYEFEEIVLPKG